MQSRSRYHRFHTQGYEPSAREASACRICSCGVVQAMMHKYSRKPPSSHLHKDTPNLRSWSNEDSCRLTFQKMSLPLRIFSRVSSTSKERADLRQTVLILDSPPTHVRSQRLTPSRSAKEPTASQSKETYSAHRQLPLQS